MSSPNLQNDEYSRLFDEVPGEHHGLTEMKWGTKLPPRSEPVRVTITKASLWGYQIELTDNLLGYGPFWTMTLRGARRKASRILYKWCVERGLLHKRIHLEYIEEGLSKRWDED